MTARRFSGALQALSDDPAAMVQLRKLVIGLAIAGRLESNSSQNPEELLRAIIAAHPTGRLSEISGGDNFPNLTPHLSACTTLGNIARIEKGRTGIKQALPGGYPLVVTAAQRGSSDHYDFEGPAAIVPLVSSTGHGNASIQRLHYQEGQFALGTILAAIFPHDPKIISARFIFEYLSTFKEELLVSRMTGTANVTLTIGSLTSIPIPLVGPAVQRRVDELMALCDRLDAAHERRERARDRFTAASLARLNAPNPETFRADARFALDALDALPALTARADQIKQLRQTILNLAVRGKLVPQDPNDEPAAVELTRVAELKVEKSLQKPKKVAPIQDVEKWCQTPFGWEWARWDQITDWITYGFTRPMEHVDHGVPIVTGKNVNEGSIIFDTASLTPEASFSALNEKDKPKPGDILITKDGSIGRTAIVEERHLPFCINQSVAVMWLRSCHFDRRFLKLVLDAPQTQDVLAEKTAGVAIKHISVTDLGKMVFPIPPLAEQRRIVAKVDELMALCDRLEANLTATAETRRRLLDALLAEALAPNLALKLEAAE